MSNEMTVTYPDMKNAYGNLVYVHVGRWECHATGADFKWEIEVVKVETVDFVVDKK